MKTGSDAVVYLDSSAIVKLVVTEPESESLRDFLAVRENRLASVLARVEVLRALRRSYGAAAPTLHHAEHVLEGIALVAVDEPILLHAARLQPDRLRSLDAIHLATALSLDGLEAMVTYDRRLRGAATEAGIGVAAPE